MKVHYINILLFALPLNILEHNQRNHKNTTLNTQNNRSLCECELYSPANYDNDPQMKKAMQQFEDRTSQRFHEYNERVKTTRQQCKDQCDKEIQKIILKDKLEKELMDKFATLHTDIQSDAIPTCVCEKSVADKMEKFCLNCGVNVGGGVTFSSGVLGGIGEAAISAWKVAEIKAAIASAEKAGALAGEAACIEAGKKLVIGLLKHLHIDELVPDICETISRASHYNELISFTKIIADKRQMLCGASGKSSLSDAMCRQININLGTIAKDGNGLGLPDSLAIPQTVNGIVDKATTTANHFENITSESVTATLKAQKTGAIQAGFDSTITSINAAIIAIVVIVLIMVIIYLILRYRRKKKMKKKLQYIKLLEK
ncbi:rifin [Plasmodium reichenowi]|uniref:Rifin n=1 Tax=Plasmodium reichenowi TaxID=5854 RepID=A0A060RMQ9_PLARE|nr:rifin [Plasmodium reichenowi]